MSKLDLIANAAALKCAMYNIIETVTISNCSKTAKYYDCTTTETT